MFRAIGIAAQVNLEKNTISVKVRIEDDRTNPAKVIKEAAFGGTDLNDVKSKIQAELAAMKRAADDTTVTDAVVGKVLASI